MGTSKPWNQIGHGRPHFLFLTDFHSAQLCKDTVSSKGTKPKVVLKL